jgi:hypothetical protein
MNLQEIKQAIEQGKNVKWANDNYNVIKDSKNQYFIQCSSNSHAIGLFWADGKTLNGKEEDFYIKN